MWELKYNLIMCVYSICMYKYIHKCVYITYIAYIIRAKTKIVYNKCT